MLAKSDGISKRPVDGGAQSGRPTDGVGDARPDVALTERLADELSRRIVTGAIPQGSWIRQDTVSTEFAVSRTPVREAFRMLEGRGILELIPHRGALVRGITTRDIRESHEVRAELESFAAEVAAERADTGHLQIMEAALDEFDEVAVAASSPQGHDIAATDLERRWAEANEQFHQGILRAAHNTHLEESVRQLRRHVPHNTTFAAMAGNHRRLHRNATEHRQIYEAIRDGDGPTARQLARAHLLAAAAAIVRHVEHEER